MQKKIKYLISFLLILCLCFACETTEDKDEDKNVSVEKVTLDQTAATVAPLSTVTLKATVTPDNATNSTVTWTTSDEKIATVNAGKVTGVTYGEVTITATADGKKAACTVTVKDEWTNAGTYDASFWDNASVYFVITDRFYNGNTANDAAYGREKGDPTVPADCGKFYGGDIAGLTAKLDYLENLGINAIWLTAPYEQIHGWCCGGYSGGTPTFKYYPYHGYYAMDYTNMDASMGTKDEFRTFVDTAHAKGIRVVLDVVMNHPGYNTLEDAINLYPGVLKTDRSVAGWQTSFKESVGLVNYHSNIDYNGTGSYYDKSTGWGAWWGSSWVRAGLEGYTSGGNTDELKCVNDMPDFKTESSAPVSLPQFLVKKHSAEMAMYYPTDGYSVVALEEKTNYTVRKYLVYWLSSWVKEFGIDGFRCDTAKHVEKAAWKELKDACTTALTDWKTANPTKKIDDLAFWMTGEVWGQDVVKNEYFTDAGFDSLINFKFRSAVKTAISDLNKIDLTYRNYTKKINTDKDFNVLSYISSHDTGSDDSKGVFFSDYSNSVPSFQIAAGSLLAMCPGAIQIYYGDEAGRKNSSLPASDDKDQKNRSQMPWASDVDGYNASLSYTFNSSIHDHWAKMLNFRKAHPAIGAGSHKRVSLSPYAFAREKGDDKVVVVLGAEAGDVTIDVSTIGAATVKDEYSGVTKSVVNGKATFAVDANGTLLISSAD